VPPGAMGSSSNAIVPGGPFFLKPFARLGLSLSWCHSIELLYFDLWHYGGRTAKHGAFMGGADFVQWHGFYDVYNKMRELDRMAAELRKEKGHGDAKAASR